MARSHRTACVPRRCSPFFVVLAPRLNWNWFVVGSRPAVDGGQARHRDAIIRRPTTPTGSYSPAVRLNLCPEQPPDVVQQ